MKKITKIEFQKNNKDRVNIYLDESFAFSLDLNTMIKYSLRKNLELDDIFIEEILKAEEEINVYNYALKILSKTSKTEKQLRLKMLEKGYDHILIDNAISKLKDQKYLDDERFSESYIKNKVDISKYGKRKIKEGLYQRGVDRQIIEEKLSKLSDEDELERAYLLGTKKLKSLKEADLSKKRNKLTYYLINKGFEFSIVRKTVSQLLGSIDMYDEF